MLELFARFEVRYLVIGGLAFIYHAKPRYTKDMDLWLAPDRENVAHANEALAAFGSPHLLDPDQPGEILQLGVAPNRIDLLRQTAGVDFDEAWSRRIEAPYGRATAYWIDLETLIEVKSRIDDPRHQEDARVLRRVQERLSEES